MENMGVDGLWPAVNSKSHIQKMVPFKSFSGYRILVDASGLFFKHRCKARERIIYKKDVLIDPFSEDEADEIWIKICYEASVQFLRYGITPVFIFDGKSNELKAETREERDEKINTGKSDFEKIKISFQSSNSITSNQQLLAMAREALTKMHGVPQKSKLKLVNFFASVGIPVVQCAEEAERLCSAMSREGYGVVLSGDGDNLAHGARILLRGISDASMLIDNSFEKSFDIVYLQDILDEFDVSEDLFTQACILAGCDYNRSVKIKGIAFAKAVERLKRYGSLQEMSRYEDISSIRWMESLNLFSRKPAKEMFEGGFINVMKYEDSMGKSLRIHGLGDCIETHKTLLSMFNVEPKPFIHRPLTSKGVVLIMDDDAVFNEIENVHHPSSVILNTSKVR